MTATRSHIFATMPRLCVTKISATPVSCWMSFRRSRYWAWIVTSRFVVGSSAMTSLGPPASAMAPTAAHLMRILAHAPLGRRDPDGAEQALDALAKRATPQLLVEERGLRHLAKDREERVQRGHRILEDHGDPAAADPSELALALARQVLALEDDASAHDPGGARQEPDDREAGGRLPAARFADEPQGLARAEAEADAVHRLDDARAAEGEEMRLEVDDLKDRVARHGPQA